MIASSRVVYGWQQGVPPTMALVKNAWVLQNFAFTLLVQNHSCWFHDLDISDPNNTYIIWECVSYCTNSSWLHNLSNQKLKRSDEVDNSVSFPGINCFLMATLVLKWSLNCIF